MSTDLRSAARILGIDPRTLASKMERLGIEATRDAIDQRRWLLTSEQIDQIRELLVVGETTDTVNELRQRMSELERRVSALELR
jgi:hypothetical protein